MDGTDGTPDGVADEEIDGDDETGAVGEIADPARPSESAEPFAAPHAPRDTIIAATIMAAHAAAATRLTGLPQTFLAHTFSDRLFRLANLTDLTRLTDPITDRSDHPD